MHLPLKHTPPLQGVSLGLLTLPVHLPEVGWQILVISHSSATTSHVTFLHLSARRGIGGEETWGHATLHALHAGMPVASLYVR